MRANELIIDGLAILATLLMGAGVWLAFALPGLLVFGGGVLLGVAAVLALAPQRGGGRP